MKVKDLKVILEELDDNIDIKLHIGKENETSYWSLSPIMEVQQYSSGEKYLALLGTIPRLIGESLKEKPSPQEDLKTLQIVNVIFDCEAHGGVVHNTWNEPITKSDLIQVKEMTTQEIEEWRNKDLKFLERE